MKYFSSIYIVVVHEAAQIYIVFKKLFDRGINMVGGKINREGSETCDFSISRSHVVYFLLWKNRNAKE